MSIIFSRHCEYALQAVLYLASKPEGEMTSIKEITKRLNIPYHFIGKILQDLTYKKILVSMTGPTGGFAFAKSPKKISLMNIIEAIDGTEIFHSCVMGLPECGGKNPCAIHDKWGKIKENIRQMLVSKSIYEMAIDMKNEKSR